MGSSDSKSKVDTHEVNKATYDRISGIYARKNFEAMNMIPQMDKFLKHIPMGGKILDLGCGPGHDTQYMSEQGYSLVGVDFSEKMIKIGEKRVPNVQFIHADIRNYEIELEEYDGVWCNSVLLHFQDREKLEMIERIYRGLKEDGILHISFSEGEGERLLEREVEGVSDRKVYYDINEKEVRKYLEQAGFEIFDFIREVYKITFILFLCRK